MAKTWRQVWRLDAAASATLETCGKPAVVAVWRLWWRVRHSAVEMDAKEAARGRVPRRAMSRRNRKASRHERKEGGEGPASDPSAGSGLAPETADFRLLLVVPASC